MEKPLKKAIALLFTITCICLFGAPVQAATIPDGYVESLAFQPTSGTFTQTVPFSGSDTQCYSYVPASTGLYGFTLTGMRMEIYDSRGEAVLPDDFYFLLEQGQTYYLYFYADGTIDAGTVTITPVIDLDADGTIDMVIGGTRQLNVRNSIWALNVTFTSSDSSIVTVDENGFVTAVGTGSTYIYLGGTTVTGQTISDYIYVAVSDPSLDQTSLIMNLYTGTKITDGDYSGYYSCNDSVLHVQGITEYNQVTARVLNANGEITKNAAVTVTWSWFSDSYLIRVYPKKTGDYTIEVSVGDKTLTCELHVFNLYFKRNTKTVADNKNSKWVPDQSMLALYPGESTTLTVKNATGKIKWTSSDKSVAKVDSAGKITAKGAGYATISAKCGNYTISYEVGVAHKTAILALRSCYKLYGSISYSQPKRMSSGYADCSSFVWKGYKAAGKYLGSKYYALTAAGLSDWCKNQGYRMFYGKADVSALLPGDLIFWCGANNGRSDGIYHVDLYQGLGTTLTVENEKHFQGTLTKVIIARPCMQPTSSVQVKAAGNKKLTVSWKKMYGVTGYEIYQSTSVGGTYTKVATVKGDAATSWTSDKLVSGKTYYYKIRPYWRANKKTYRAAYSSAASAKVKK